jgi:alcohol dehydrogenase YqhD (iron-dependent ADH family)
VQNFVFQNPVKVLFGRSQIANIAAEIPANAKILMTYGRGSIERNGVYERVQQALAGYVVSKYRTKTCKEGVGKGFIKKLNQRMKPHVSNYCTSQCLATAARLAWCASDLSRPISGRSVSR